MSISLDEVKDAPMFSLNETEIKAKVVSVYDGDTIKCVFPLLNSEKLFKWNCRLTGVDTPEIRTRNKKEKEFGKQVRDNLKEKILNKVVTLKCGNFDKYGRLLVELKDYCEDETCTINQWLINKNYAFPYNGGKKSSWSEYLDSTK